MSYEAHVLVKLSVSFVKRGNIVPLSVPTAVRFYVILRFFLGLDRLEWPKRQACFPARADLVFAPLCLWGGSAQENRDDRLVEKETRRVLVFLRNIAWFMI